MIGDGKLEVQNYICTQCGNRGNTSNIDVKGVHGSDEIRNKQLEINN